MKTFSQIRPLLKQMLGFYRYGPLPVILYILITTIIVHFSLIVLPEGWMRSHSQPRLWSEQLFFGCIVWWFFLMLVATPLPFLLLGGPMSLEFTFTRAVDRVLWLRAERIAVILIGLGPLILNLLWSPFGSPLAFDPVDATNPGYAIQQRYIQTFPGSQVGPLVSLNGYHTTPLIIHNGAALFAAWLLWFGLLCVFLVAAYFSLIFKSWQRAGMHHSKSKTSHWLGIIMVNTPAYSPVLLLILFAAMRINIFEESFLLFASHPLLWSLGLLAMIVIIERQTEKNLQKLEFAFS